MSAAINNTFDTAALVNIHSQPLKEVPSPVALGYYATVVDITITADGAVNYQLDYISTVKTGRPAEGLLVMPESGDTVLCIDVNNEILVSQVLLRAEPSQTLSIHSTRPIEWVAPVMRFKALKEMELLSANTLTLSACDVVLGATRSLVQQAKNFMQSAKTFSLTTKGLMRFNGKQQLIVAEEDLRMDAKRINMG